MKVIDNEDNILSNSSFPYIKKVTKRLLNKIKTSVGRSFEIPEIMAFLEKNRIRHIKSSALKKKDIKIVVHDLQSRSDATLSLV